MYLTTSNLCGAEEITRAWGGEASTVRLSYISSLKEVSHSETRVLNLEENVLFQKTYLYTNMIYTIITIPVIVVFKQYYMTLSKLLYDSYQ